MSYASDIRELRYLDGATQSTTFTDGSSGTWAAGTAGKLDVAELNTDSLGQEPIPSGIMKQGLGGSTRTIAGPRAGNVDFSIYPGSGSASTTPEEAAVFLAKCLGNTDATDPAAKSDVTDSAGVHTTSRVYATAHGISAGCMVKVGVEGDARGEGKIRYVSAVDTDYLDLYPDLPGAPDDGDALVFTHYANLSNSWVARYFDFLFIGHGASAGDQIQVIGAVPTVGFNFALGSPLQAQLTFNITDWQYSPAGELDQVEGGTAADNYGEMAPPSRLLGQFVVAESDGSYIEFPAGEFSVNPGMELATIPDANKPNGVGGFRLVSFVPTVEATIILGTHDSPALQNLEADYRAGTQKSLILSAGTTQQNSVSMFCQYMKLADSPKRVDINGLTGVKCMFEGYNHTSQLFGVHWL